MKRMVRPCWTARILRVVKLPPSRVSLHVVDHVAVGVAGSQEVAVERVHDPLGGHGLAGGRQRLADDLAAEDRQEAEVLTATAEDGVLDLLQLEKLEQDLERLAHQHLLARTGPAIRSLNAAT